MNFDSGTSFYVDIGVIIEYKKPHDLINSLFYKHFKHAFYLASFTGLFHDKKAVLTFYYQNLSTTMNLLLVGISLYLLKE